MKLITTVNGYPEQQEIDLIWSGYDEPHRLDDAEQRSSAVSSLQIEPDALPDAFQHHLITARLILLHLLPLPTGAPIPWLLCSGSTIAMRVRFAFMVMFVRRNLITCTDVVSIALY